MALSRRDVLKTLGMGMLGGSFLRIVPLEAAEQVHRMIEQEKGATPRSAHVPKFFSAHQYKTLEALCQTIIPPGDGVGGALEAGAPQFIDLITSENRRYQLKLGGGLMWLDARCVDLYGNVYLDCTPAQQREILDQIAYRKNALRDPSLSPGIEFFSFLRNLTADGFFTSKIGIEYLRYIGNTVIREFPSCPPVPEA